ncbi:ribonuclease H-like domain-containing protein [Tanacetum coccineum]
MQELSEQHQELQDKEEEHGVQLKLVLELLRKEKLYAKFTKSEAFKQENVPLVGCEIDEAHCRSGTFGYIQERMKTVLYLGDCLRYLSENEIESPWILSLNFQGQSSEYDVIWVMVDKLTKLKWTIYLVVLADAAESIRDAIRFEYWVASSSGWTKRKPLEFEGGDCVLLKVTPWKGVVRFGKKGELNSVHGKFHVSNLKKCLVDANLHVPLSEIKVNKTLCFVEEPIGIMDHEVKRSGQAKLLALNLGTRFPKGGDCDNRVLSSVDRSLGDWICVDFLWSSLSGRARKVLRIIGVLGSHFVGGLSLVLSIDRDCSRVRQCGDNGNDDSSGPTTLVADEIVYEDRGDNMERASTTAASLDAEQDSGSGPRHQDTILEDRPAQTRIKSSANKRLGDQEDASKEWRNIAESDQDEEISFVQEDVETQGRYDQDIDVTTVSVPITTIGASVSLAKPSTPPTTTNVIKDEDLTIAQTLVLWITGQMEVRLVWNNAQRVNHQNKLTHPHPKRNLVPTAVLAKSGNVLVNTAKQSSPRVAISNSTARYVNTDASKPTMNGAKPCSNVFYKSHSLVKRTIYQRTTPKNSDFKEKVNTAKVNNVTTAGIKVVVSVVQEHKENAVKSSTCWIWRPTGKGNPQYALQDQGIFYSGCSRHMTGNKSYLTDYQDIDGGFVAFFGSPKGGKISGKVFFFTKTEYLIISPDFKLLDESKVLFKVPRQNNMYNFNLKNVVPSGDLTCLFVKAIIDESNLWHRRLGHVNFKTMNKLMRGNLVRGCL